MQSCFSCDLHWLISRSFLYKCTTCSRDCSKRSGWICSCDLRNASSAMWYNSRAFPRHRYLNLLFSSRNHNLRKIIIFYTTKVSLWHIYMQYSGKAELYLQPICNLALQGGGWSAPGPGRFIIGKETVRHVLELWSLGTDLDSKENHASTWIRSPDHPVPGQSHGHMW